MDDFIKNPASLFDVKGKVAVVTGASGAFGALAAKILAGAGCKLVLTAGSKDALAAKFRRSARPWRGSRGPEHPSDNQRLV